MEEVEARTRYVMGRDVDEEIDKKTRVVNVVEVHKLNIGEDDEEVNRSIYQGSTTYNMGVVANHSFIPATHHQIDSLFDLKDLSCSHEFLLSIISDIQIKSKPFLVTVPVCTIDQYFATQFPYSHKNWTKPEWWEHISNTFMVLFRDVTTALLYIYHKDWKCCGNLTSNIYVTKNGRARILPSCDNSINRSKDVEDLIQVMKNVLQLPFQNDQSEFKAEDFHLPRELVHLFSYVPEFISIVPSSYLVDHPSFWEVSETDSFIWKLVLMMPQCREFESALSHTLSKDKGFRNWSDRLFKKDVEEIYREGGEQEIIDVKQILSREDIDIEQSLHEHYPQFYLTIFNCICTCVKEKRILDVRILKKISSRYHHRKEGECEFL